MSRGFTAETAISTGCTLLAIAVVLVLVLVLVLVVLTTDSLFGGKLTFRAWRILTPTVLATHRHRLPPLLLLLPHCHPTPISRSRGPALLRLDLHYRRMLLLVVPAWERRVGCHAQGQDWGTRQSVIPRVPTSS